MNSKNRTIISLNSFWVSHRWSRECQSQTVLSQHPSSLCCGLRSTSLQHWIHLIIISVCLCPEIVTTNHSSNLSSLTVATSEGLWDVKFDHKQPSHRDKLTNSCCAYSKNIDSWGRDYEDSVYQSLPTDFEVWTAENRCCFCCHRYCFLWF